MKEAAAKARNERALHWIELGIVEWPGDLDFRRDTQNSGILHLRDDVQIVTPLDEIDFARPDAAEFLSPQEQGSNAGNSIVDLGG